MFSNSLYGSTAKLENCQILKEESYLLCLAGAYVTKTDTLLGVSREAVSKVMTAYTDHWKTSAATKNSGRKPTQCTLKSSVSKTHSTVAANVTEKLNTHLETPASIKAIGRVLHKPNIHSCNCQTSNY